MNSTIGPIPWRRVRSVQVESRRATSRLLCRGRPAPPHLPPTSFPVSPSTPDAVELDALRRREALPIPDCRRTGAFVRGGPPTGGDRTSRAGDDLDASFQAIGISGGDEAGPRRRSSLKAVVFPETHRLSPPSLTRGLDEVHAPNDSRPVPTLALRAVAAGLARLRRRRHGPGRRIDRRPQGGLEVSAAHEARRREGQVAPGPMSGPSRARIGTSGLGRTIAVLVYEDRPRSGIGAEASRAVDREVSIRLH